MHANNSGMCDNNDVDNECLECNGEGICCKDPQWASWGSWAPCMNTCGPEETTRMRDCDYDDDECSDIPEIGNCKGMPSQTKDCPSSAICCPRE